MALDGNHENGTKYWSAVNRLTPKHPMLYYAWATRKLKSAKGLPPHRVQIYYLNKHKFKECKSAFLNVQKYSQVLKIFRISELKGIAKSSFGQVLTSHFKDGETEVELPEIFLLCTKKTSALFRLRQNNWCLYIHPVKCIKKAQKTIPKKTSFVFPFLRASIYLAF